MRNPLSRGQSYFPPWSNQLAYHATTHRQRSVVGPLWQQSEANFQQLWASGWILSAAARRGDVAGAIMSYDLLAGDAENVFLSVSQPLSFQGDSGYYLLFDAETLLNEGAQLGVVDLLEGYQDVLADARDGGDWKDYANLPLDQWPPALVLDFRQGVEELQSQLRFTGSDARRWSRWLFSDEEKPPRDLFDRAEHYLYEVQHSTLHMPADLGQARRFAELVVPHHLDLERSDGLEGVAFRHIYFELDDFLNLFETEPGRPILAELGNQCWTRGYPYRCPECHTPLVDGGTIAEILGDNPWLHIWGGDRVMVQAVPCNTCQAYLVLEQASQEDVSEPDLWVDFAAVEGSVPYDPGQCR